MLKKLWKKIADYWEVYAEARTAYIKAKYRYELMQTMPEYLQYDVGLKNDSHTK